MRAKLYIKGDKEPIELDFMEGKSAEGFLNDKTVPDDARFSIEGLVNVVKRDMRYVKFEVEPVYASDKKKEKEMSAPDFTLMQGEMVVAQAQAVAEGFTERDGKDFWYQAQKGIRLEFPLNWEKKRYIQIFVTNPREYMRLQEEMELYEDKLFQIEFAKKKELEHLAKLAEQQKIK